MYFCIRLFRAFRPGPCILHSPAGAGSDAAADQPASGLCHDAEPSPGLCICRLYRWGVSLLTL